MKLLARILRIAAEVIVAPVLYLLMPLAFLWLVISEWSWFSGREGRTGATLTAIALKGRRKR